MQPDILYHRLSICPSPYLKDRDFRKPAVDEECSHSDGSIIYRRSELPGAQNRVMVGALQKFQLESPRDLIRGDEKPFLDLKWGWVEHPCSICRFVAKYQHVRGLSLAQAHAGTRDQEHLV